MSAVYHNISVVAVALMFLYALWVLCVALTEGRRR